MPEILYTANSNSTPSVMDLDPIGKHCALQSCNVLDLLPIQCSCLGWFCNLHISPDLHDCSAVQQQQPSSSSSSSSSARMRSKCAFSRCNKLSLVIGVTAVAREGESGEATPGGCPGCQLSFCVEYVRRYCVAPPEISYTPRSHRHMQSHACIGFAAGKDDVKHEAARAILAQKFSASTSTSHTPVVARRQRNLPPDSQKLAQLQKVNLMKLRHRAIPADPKDRGSMVPVFQRLHVTVRLEIVGRLAKETALWFRKVMQVDTKLSFSNVPQTTITGKALDLVVQHFSVSHTGSVSFLLLWRLSSLSVPDATFKGIVRGNRKLYVAESFGVIGATRGWINSCADCLRVKRINILGGCHLSTHFSFYLLFPFYTSYPSCPPRNRIHIISEERNT